MIIGGGIFSLREIMHTLSANSAQERSRNSVLHLSDPGPWDALICSSTAGKKIVKGSLEDQDNDLRWRHGATRLERPQLPVISLEVAPPRRPQWKIQNHEDDIAEMTKTSHSQPGLFSLSTVLICSLSFKQPGIRDLCRST